MINFGNISIADLRLGATQVKAAYLGNKQVWSLGPVVLKYDIQSIGRTISKQGTTIEITEQAGETITLYIKTNATDLTNKQVCAAVYLNSTDVTPYASFAFSNVSLAGRYITGTTPDVSTWVPSGFPETYSTLYMKTWIQDAGYIDPADALGEVLDWTGEEPPPVVEPLCFTASTSSANSINLVKNGSPAEIYLETSTDGITWSDWNYSTTTIWCNAGEKVYIRAKNENQTIGSSSSNYYRFDIQNGSFAVSGSIQTLLKADGSRTDAPAYCYYRLFAGGRKITSAPALPATTIAEYCYSYMFQDGTSLTTAPALPATTLANNCYEGMFSSCTSLTTAPALPATTLATYCYSNMFRECTSLTTAPALPATTLAQSCYSYMFRDCTSLTSAPALPVTTLAVYCYNGMFYGCTSLTTAPALPATTLVLECYSYMFYGCTSLTTAPALPAITIDSRCYQNMFNGCTSLNSVEVAITEWNKYGAVVSQNWLYNVAASGTFTCPAALPDIRDASHIPEGWTVVNPTIAVEYIESNGTQYIDTGINGNTVYGVEFSFMAPTGVEQTTAWANPLASVMDNFTLGFYNLDTSKYFLRWRTQEVFQANAQTGVKQTLEISQNTITFGDSSYTIATPQPVCTASGNIMICTNTALSRLAKVKIYGLKLYDSSFNLLRDLVPVRVGNVGYLYDNVSNTLFGNSGSGEFIIGPDV